MRATTSILLLAMMLLACGDPGPAQSDAAVPDDGVPADAVCTLYDGTRCGGAGSANAGCAPDPCNWCDCGSGWGGTNRASCTEVGCPAPADAGADNLRCHTQSDCPAGYACIFNVGCDRLLGQCNSQTFYCPHNQTTFTLCDCDGHTVVDTVSSCAPDRRYAHAGACP
jgi:hypothetical protein